MFHKHFLCFSNKPVQLAIILTYQIVLLAIDLPMDIIESFTTQCTTCNWQNNNKIV